MKTDSGTSPAAGGHQLRDVAAPSGPLSAGCPCSLTGVCYVLASHGAAPHFCSSGGWPGKSEWQQPGWSAVTSGRAMTAGAGEETCGWHRSLQSAALSVAFLVSAWWRCDPFSAVRRGCNARDALRSAVGSGRALQGLANPLQESSCGLFQIPSLNWLIRAGRSVWRGRQGADTCTAVGEGRLSLQGSDEERLVLPLPSQTSACSPESLSSKSSAVLGCFPCSF